MRPRLPEELLTKWRADIDAHFEARKQELDLEHQRAHEELNLWWSEGTEDSKESTSVAQATTTVSQRNSVAPNGSANMPGGKLTRSKMVRTVIPELGNSNFTQADVKMKILERWPEAESKHLSSNVSQLLKRMTDKGELVRIEKGEDFSPSVYRMSESDEGGPVRP